MEQGKFGIVIYAENSLIMTNEPFDKSAGANKKELGEKVMNIVTETKWKNLSSSRNFKN